jgi:hypothetical protein
MAMIAGDLREHKAGAVAVPCAGLPQGFSVAGCLVAFVSGLQAADICHQTWLRLATAKAALLQPNFTVTVCQHKHSNHISTVLGQVTNANVFVCWGGIMHGSRLSYLAQALQCKTILIIMY